MRIVYLHQYFNTPRDAGSTRSYEFARRLVARGHQVDMITTSRASGGRGWNCTGEAGINVHWLAVPYSNAMSYPQRIRAFLKFAVSAAVRAAAIPADVVFATSTPLTIAIPGVFAARRQRVPMVFEVRDLWPELPIAIGALHNPVPVFLARQLERFAYRNAAQIVALSPGMKDGVAHTGYPAEQITVIPNSADLELFDVPPAIGTAFRRRYDWLGERPLVVYTGTLGLINGVSYLVDLAFSMHFLDPEVRFLVVGTGAEEDKVRTLAAALGVLDVNFFMIPGLPKHEMPAILSAADVATSLFADLPAMWSNSANKFFDALAAGKPIAINYQGWQADLLRDTGVGLVLPANDIQRAAEMLAAFLQDKERLAEVGRASRRLAVEEFSRDRAADQLEHVLTVAIAEYR